MDSLQEVMTNEIEEIAVAGAKGFGQVGLMHYVMEWGFEQLDDVNPAFQRQRGLQCLAAVAEDFPSMQAIDAFCAFVKDPDPVLARLASKAIPVVAKSLLADAPASVNETLLSAVMALLAETAVNPDMHLLAAEALVALPGSVGMCDPNTEQALGPFVAGDDWGLIGRSANVLVCMMPDSCVDFLLGWVSGDESQMPAVATGPNKRIDIKEIRIEACRLLGLITPACSRFETVQDALLQVMEACTELITEVDVAVAALEALGSKFTSSDNEDEEAAGGGGGDGSSNSNPELTAAVIALLKMKPETFPGHSTGEVEDRILVAQTAALTALSKLKPPAELCDHLNSFLLNATPPADLLWEPAAAALQACRLAHPKDAAITAALEESHRALEW
jgi:hypothetical protein